MSLLGNLVTQVARQALDPNDAKTNSANQQAQSRSTGGLGGVLGSVLGGNTTESNQTNSASNNGLGMDDILGSVLGSQLGSSNSNTGGLGSVLGSVLNSGMGNMASTSSGGGKGMLVAALMPVVLSWIQRNGGLSGALSKVQSMGFGNQAQSWMSTQQQNDNLDPQAVDKLFDTQEIEQVAQKTGTDEHEVRQGLAELLPEVMNQLTPTGGLDKEQQANQEIDEILQQISSTLKS